MEDKMTASEDMANPAEGSSGNNCKPAIAGLEMIEKVGEGGMAEVWKAYDQANKRLVAAKILKREFSDDDSELDAFRNEERIMAEINHPGIVQAFDFNNCGDNWYYLMEYVDGYSFSELLRRKQHIRESDCLLISESIALALDFAWNDHGLTHCDIKPENIMINTDGVVKLTDLGIARQFQFSENVPMPDHILGTPAYISPEQIYGDVEPDCRADIYSLGATLYHLSTGRTLFPSLGNEDTMRAHCDENRQAHDPRFYRPELSEGFCQMLEAMLVKDREERISSWRDVYTMCREIEDGRIFKPRQSAAKSSIKLGI